MFVFSFLQCFVVVWFELYSVRPACSCCVASGGDVCHVFWSHANVLNSTADIFAHSLTETLSPGTAHRFHQSKTQILLTVNINRINIKNKAQIINKQQTNINNTNLSHSWSQYNHHDRDRTWNLTIKTQTFLRSDTEHLQNQKRIRSESNHLYEESNHKYISDISLKRNHKSVKVNIIENFNINSN